MASAAGSPLGLEAVCRARGEALRVGVADKGELDIHAADQSAGVPEAVRRYESGDFLNVLPREHEVNAVPVAGQMAAGDGVGHDGLDADIV